MGRRKKQERGGTTQPFDCRGRSAAQTDKHKVHSLGDWLEWGWAKAGEDPKCTKKLKKLTHNKLETAKT